MAVLDISKLKGKFKPETSQPAPDELPALPDSKPVLQPLPDPMQRLDPIPQRIEQPTQRMEIPQQRYEQPMQPQFQEQRAPAELPTFTQLSEQKSPTEKFIEQIPKTLPTASPIDEASVNYNPKHFKNSLFSDVQKNLSDPQKRYEFEKNFLNINPISELKDRIRRNSKDNIVAEYERYINESVETLKRLETDWRKVEDEIEERRKIMKALENEIDERTFELKNIIVKLHEIKGSNI
jgi:hypothetical protein